MNQLAQVRPAEPTDLASLTSFDLFPGDRIVEIVERRMLVADIAGTIGGYIAWQRQGCIGKDYVNKLVIKDSCRRRGLAKLLLNALSETLEGRVFVSTGARNVAANDLLVGDGWMRAGEIVGLLPDGEPEIFYRKDFNQ